MKEASLKSLHTIWFQLYDIVEKESYGDSKYYATDLTRFSLSTELSYALACQLKTSPCI